jgi:hypothetical protein
MSLEIATSEKPRRCRAPLFWKYSLRKVCLVVQKAKRHSNLSNQVSLGSRMLKEQQKSDFIVGAWKRCTRGHHMRIPGRDLESSQRKKPKFSGTRSYHAFCYFFFSTARRDSLTCACDGAPKELPRLLTIRWDSFCLRVSITLRKVSL